MKKKLLILLGIFFAAATTAFICWIFIPYRSIIAQSSSTSDDVYNRQFAENYIVFKTQDGELLSGWFFRRGKGTELVVCIPGNYCNAGMFAAIAQNDNTRSYLMLNYRGYGNSTGRLKEANMVNDVREISRHYASEIQTDKIILLGFSLGTGVAIQAAARNSEIDKIILVAPFDSMIDMTNVSTIARLILKDHFNSIDYAPEVKCPVYVIYSEDDKVVFPERTRRLISQFSRPVVAKKGTGSHTDIISLPENVQYIYEALQAK